jgi:hypothetical protein
MNACIQVDWKIHDKGADMLLIERGVDASDVMRVLPLVMKQQTSSYTGSSIAEEVYKMITTK